MSKEYEDTPTLDQLAEASLPQAVEEHKHNLIISIENGLDFYIYCTECDRGFTTYPNRASDVNGNPAIAYEGLQKLIKENFG